MQPIAVAAIQQYASLAAETRPPNIQSRAVPIPVAGSAAGGAPGRYIYRSWTELVQCPGRIDVTTPAVSSS